MLMKADQSTLLLIDVQERLMPAISESDAVAERCITLATIAGLLGVPAIATEQIPEKLGPNLEGVKELCNKTLEKTHFDACPDGLIDELPEGRQHIVIGGCETHVWVVADATGSRSELDRDVALDRLHQSGARIVTTEMVAFEWMVHCKHPHFRDIQALIK